MKLLKGLVNQGLMSFVSAVFFSCTLIAAHADDTEIFFGGEASDHALISPNILFIIDNSGSMSWGINDGTNRTRMNVLKSSFKQLMDSTSEIPMKAGLIRMHNNNYRPDMESGIYHSVQDIHTTVNDGGVSTPFIARSSDDGFQWLNGQVILDQHRLAIGKHQSKSTYVGVRFSNVSVPHGAVIKSARLEFSSETDETDPMTLNIRGIKQVNPETFSNADNSLTARPQTLAAKEWELGEWSQLDEFGDESRYSVDVKEIVTEITTQSDWCGGNAMGFILSAKTDGSSALRSLSSYDSSRENPSLIIDYEYDWENPNAYSGTGCQRVVVHRAIDAGDDDAQRRSNDTLLNYDYLYLSGGAIGLRYQNIPLSKGAKIDEAYIEFTAVYNSSYSVDIDIQAHDTSDSEGFTSNPDSITGRERTSASVRWIPERWQQGRIYRTPNLASVIEEVVAREDWKPGNTMSLIVDRRGNTNHDNNGRYVYSRNRSIAQSPRLVLKVGEQEIDESGAPTVKDQLVSYVNAMGTGGGTPTIAMLANAQEYFSSLNRTPITNTCQTNHIILLSDGEPNAMTPSVASKVARLTGKKCENSNDIGEQTTCGRNLTAWMETTDQVPSMGGETKLITHTIAYASNSQAKGFLRNIASPNKGGDKRYYEANDANDLLEAFGSILQDILSNESSFVSPSISVNQYRSYQHNNELFYALFTPERTTNWHGNIKKYQLAAKQDKDTGMVTYFLADQNGKEAVNQDTGGFTSGSQSFWSTEEDGNNTRLGGAASRLPSPEDRLLVTDVQASKGSSLKAQPMAVSNSDITGTILGSPNMSSEKRKDIIKWAKGYNPATNNSFRQQIGDPLHSQPALVYYGCKNYKDPKNKKAGCTTPADDLISIVFGTNQGIFHAINGQNGREQFAFFPEKLMPNLRKFMDNDSLGGASRTYGIDGSPTIWRHDANDDGAITLPPKPGDEADHVYAYFGLRRGGDSYYALDITNPADPKYLWHISAATRGFEEMGQSWSKPKLASVLLSGKPRKVLIFGAGYDASNDQIPNARQPDALGNAIYIVDAKDGKLLWKATNKSDAVAGSAGMLVLPKMEHSIPGDISSIDLNLDGQANQLVFADMGGQIWRLFIDNEKGYKSNNLHIDPFGGTGPRDARGVVAQISDGNESGNRRFYMRPVMGITKAGDRDMFTISIGSGHRARPLSKVVEDRIYVFKSTAIFNNPASTPTLLEKDLYDATSDDVSSDNEAKREAAKRYLSLSYLETNEDGEEVVKFLNHGGWYITMESPGEKILSDISLINGNISFVSYEPRTDVNSCNPVIGVNRFYRVNVSDASAAGDSRSKEIKNAGIISTTRFVVMNSNELAGDELEGIEGHVSLECIGTTCIETDQESTIFPTGWMDRAVNRQSAKPSTNMDKESDTDDTEDEDDTEDGQ